MPEEDAYRVSWARKAREILKDLGKRMRASGGAQELARVVRAVDERLRADPITLGEVYRSRGVVEEHLAVQEFLAVDFAVDTERKFVLVRDCHILSGHGL
jgi:hypothetical protein